MQSKLMREIGCFISKGQQGPYESAYQYDCRPSLEAQPWIRR